MPAKTHNPSPYNDWHHPLRCALCTPIIGCRSTTRLLLLATYSTVSFRLSQLLFPTLHRCVCFSVTCYAIIYAVRGCRQQKYVTTRLCAPHCWKIKIVESLPKNRYLDFSSTLLYHCDFDLHFDDGNITISLKHGSNWPSMIDNTNITCVIHQLFESSILCTLACSWKSITRCRGLLIYYYYYVLSDSICSHIGGSVVTSTDQLLPSYV